MKIIFLTLFLCLNVWASDIALVTLVVGKEYKEATLAGIYSKERYCKQHGYDFILCETYLDPQRPVPWSKIKLLQETLPNYRWVFFSDADSLIMDDSVRLEQFIDNAYNLVICTDVAGLNTGEFFIKNCRWSFKLLRNIYGRSEAIHTATWEQEGLRQVLEMDPKLLRKIKVMPQRTFNSFWAEWFDCVAWEQNESRLEQVTYHPGDFIIHFSACRDLNLLKESMWSYYIK